MASKPKSWKQRFNEDFEGALRSLLEMEGGSVNLDLLCEITDKSEKSLKKKVNAAMSGGGMTWDSHCGGGTSKTIVLGSRQKKKRPKTAA